jgi:hypothetical protein
MFHCYKCFGDIEHIIEPETLEAMACMEALALAEDYGIKKMIVALDCLSVVKNIKEMTRYIVTCYRITTRCIDAAEATRCSRTHQSSVMQLRGHPSCPPSARGSSLSCGSSLCSRCSTSKVSHTYGEKVLRLRTARSARSSERGRLSAAALWRDHLAVPPPSLI